MRAKPLTRFFLLAIAGLLCLMPLWYYLAPMFSVPVFYMAGEVCSTIFHWALGYERTGASGVLQTSVKIFSQHQGQTRLGSLAPVVDYRLQGYGMVMLWSLLLASRPPALVRKLLLGSTIMLVLQSLAVIVQWLNDVLNRAGHEALEQTRLPAWLAEVVAFGFHFNLFIFTALLPILIWMALNKDFVQKFWPDMKNGQRTAE